MRIMRYLNLDKTYNGAILEEFYCNFVKVRCLYGEKRHAKDIGNFENVSNHLSKISKEKVEERTNVILLLDDIKDDKLIGGVAFDYYGGVNQALIRCIVVDETMQRKEEYFQGLLDEAFSSIMLFCNEAGNMDGVKHTFFETTAVKMKCEVIVSKYCFQPLNVDHHSAFSTKPEIICRQLLIYRPISGNHQGKDGVHNSSINSQELLNFYKAYYMHNLDIDLTDLEDKLPWFKELRDHLTSINEVKICGLHPLEVHISTQVIVIGGGMAGLAASATLVESGLDVVLVEAANYFGGRVKQMKPFDGWPPVDLGGEFIHGSETITYKLAMENNWEIEMLFDYSSEAEWVYLDGQMLPYYSTHADIEASRQAYGDFINYHVTQLSNANEDDTSAAEFFNKHPEFTEKSSHIFNNIYCQTEAANLDAYGSREQEGFENSWECGSGNFRFKNSQEELVKHYLKRCEKVEKKLNWQAKEIEYATEAVVPGNASPFRVTVANQNGERITARVVMICVPVTVLKDRDITFKPELPDDKLRAIERIRMNTGLKIISRFSHRFWPENVSLVFNCTSDISQLWMYTNVKEETGEECHIVTGFQTAEYARQKAHLTADEVKDIFIKDLDGMFANEENQMPASKSLVDFVYYHWSSHPFVRGAYSSPSVNARGSREILARPLENCVFFAGEATRSSGDVCTVSGAIESGLRAAKEVVNIIYSRCEP